MKASQQQQQPNAARANANGNGASAAPPPQQQQQQQPPPQQQPPHPHAHVNAHARPFHPHGGGYHPQYLQHPQHPQYQQHPYAHPHPHSDGMGPPRGGAPPHSAEYRPKHYAPEYPEPMNHAQDGQGGAEMPPSPFKPGGPGMPLQPHARPYHVPTFIPGAHKGGMQQGMGGPPLMRGPPGYQRMRGPPRGAPGSGGMPPQNYAPPPRGGMNPRGQPFYMPQQMHPGAYGMMAPQPGGPPPYNMGPGGPMPGYPPGPSMGMGMGAMGGMVGGMNHMTPPHAHTAHAAPPPQQREKKVLAITDPKSGKAIYLPPPTKAASAAPSHEQAVSPVSPVKPAVDESASKTLKTPAKKGSVATPGAAEEMKAKVLAALEASRKAKADAASAPPPAPVKLASPKKSAAVATASSASPKKTVQKSEAVAAVVASPKKAAPVPVSPKKAAPVSPKKAAPVPGSPKKAAPMSPKKTTAPPPGLVTSPIRVPAKPTISPKKKSTEPVVETKPAPSAEKTTTVASAAAAVAKGPIVNSIVVKENGKVTYAVESLLLFRGLYTTLPLQEDGSEVTWPAMEIQIDGSVRPPRGGGGGGGGRGGGGRGGGGGDWDRERSGGGDKPGLNRQSSRGGGGGGGGGNQWSRSQEPPRQERSERGGRGGGRGGRGGGGRGGRGGQQEPLFDGPVKPLERTDNRWIPVKATSNVEAAKKMVNSIMNKMTREKFDKLAMQITEINMESLEMLQAVIKILFDKALGEPHFCDMYADLCTHLEAHWQVWSFLKIVQNDDDKKFYWTTMAESDSEVVGPFRDMSDALDSAGSDEFEPVPAPDNMVLSEVRVRGGKFIKIWTREGHEVGQPREYFWSGQLLDDLGSDQVLNGPFESLDHASRVALKTCSFKRILLNACQEEFEKDNIYEELDEKFKKDKEEGTLEPQAVADYEEKRLITKSRMLGNIRFIGELYRKGMLREGIMHECVMKLMAVKPAGESIEPTHPNNAPDEESIESLVKLLGTMGRDLEKKNPKAMGMYFAYMERKLVKDKRLSSRITFMIKDTIELRANNWQPRRKELQSKSLNEIRKEAEREQRAPPVSAPSGGHGGHGGGGHGGGGGGQRGDRPDSFRRSNSSRDGGSFGGGGQRGDRGGSGSTMAPIYQSQSMNSRSSGANKMQLPDRSRTPIQRDGSVSLGPKGRPATFGAAAATAAARRGPPASAGPALGGNRMMGGSGRGGAAGPGAGPAAKASPAVVAVPSLSEDDKEKIGKKAKAFAEEYVTIRDLAEADACYTEILKEFKSHAQVPGVVASEILKKAMEAKVEIRTAMCELLEKLSVEKSSLSFDGIKTGIQELLQFGNDLWCDVPKLHEHVALFIARFAKISDKTGVTLDWLIGGCVQAMDADIYDELIQGGFLAEVGGCLLKALNESSASDKSASTHVRSTFVTLLSLFPDYKQNPQDFHVWITKYQLGGNALGLQPAVEFATHWIESKKLEETVAWYEATIPEDVKKDPVFATLACLFVLGNVKKGDLPSEDEGMLLNGLCVSPESQTKLVAALFQTRGAVAGDETDFKALLQHLVKDLRSIPAVALSKWLELKNDTSVGRKRALAAFGDFVEELAKTK